MNSGATLTASHLQRSAYVYVRQSSEYQVQNHVERQRLQYELAGHAKGLGFRDIEVIDDDQGISGDGVHRPGFESLLEAVCKGKVGLVLSIEASRLSRNGREWHTLLDFCAIIGCLVGDRERIYDPAVIDDRMYLGLKGQFSEMELALFRQRSLESRLALAQRGKHFTTVPAGYERVGVHRIEMTPDQRQRDAIQLIFSKFRELGSIRQVFLWFRHERVEMPIRTPGKGLEWKVPTSSRPIGQMLHNPIYAGVYAYGRRRQVTVIENGRKRVRRGSYDRNPENWPVLIREHHEGYITWEQFERNRKLIAQNKTNVRGAVRNGRELLAGLLRCGHCGVRIQVYGNGKSPGYRCFPAQHEEGVRCISFGGVRVDAAVGEAVMNVLRPVGIEAALTALGERGKEHEAEVRLAKSALEEARFRAGRAEAQFNAVEPANSNVFHNLARKWEERLASVRECEARLQLLEGTGKEEGELTSDEREAYLALGADVHRLWDNANTTPQLRKRVLRAVLVEITATIRGREIHLLLHWKGGDHTKLVVQRNRTGQNRWCTDAETGAMIRDLARYLPDGQIAGLLNRLGKRTGKGNGWTRSRVRSFRCKRDIAVYRQGERQERGELVLAEAAERLNVGPGVIRRMINSGLLPARQVCKGAPWIIREEALERQEIADALSRKRPLTPNRDQTKLEFSKT